MGRNYQGKHQGYTENRGGYHGDGGGRRYNHNQHDDRDGDASSINSGRGSSNRVWSRGGTVHNRLGPRQVNFAMDGARGGGITKRSRGKNPNKNIHIVLPDDDLDMDRRSEQAGRARPPSYRGRGSRGDRGRMRYTGGPGRGITVGESSGVFSWHKVVLKNGTKYDKIVLLKELLARTETKFIPICYSKQGANTQFHLEDGAAARALRELDKKIEMPDGFPLAITVDRSTPPNMPISDELVEKIKVVMSKRYFVANKALNLSAFHVDEDFAGESFYAPLWRTNIMNRVLMVIQDNIPEVAALDLSNNKLNSTSLDFFTIFKTKVPDLRILHLVVGEMENSKIRNLRLEDGEEVETGAVQLVVGKIQCCHLGNIVLNHHQHPVHNICSPKGRVEGLSREILVNVEGGEVKSFVSNEVALGHHHLDFLHQLVRDRHVWGRGSVHGDREGEAVRHFELLVKIFQSPRRGSVLDVELCVDSLLGVADWDELGLCAGEQLFQKNNLVVLGPILQDHLVPGEHPT